jgi:hypothetical protein
MFVLGLIVGGIVGIVLGGGGMLIYQQYVRGN